MVTQALRHATFTRIDHGIEGLVHRTNSKTILVVFGEDPLRLF